MTELRETGTDTAEQVLAEVVRIVAQRLEVPDDEIDPDLSFYELGADSLDLIMIGRYLGRRFRLRVALAELLDPDTGPARLARLVAERAAAAETGESPGEA